MTERSPAPTPAGGAAEAFAVRGTARPVSVPRDCAPLGNDQPVALRISRGRAWGQPDRERVGRVVGCRLRGDRQRESGGRAEGSGQELRQRRGAPRFRIGEHDPRLAIEPEFAGPGLEAPGRRNDRVSLDDWRHRLGRRSRARASRGDQCERERRPGGRQSGPAR